MIPLIVLWILAMTAGLCWAGWPVAAATIAMVVVFLWTSAGLLAHWTGWLQLCVMGATPWLLAAQRNRHLAELADQQRQEARLMIGLQEVTRELLSLQAAGRDLESQITELTKVYHVTKVTSRALHLAELFGLILELAPDLTQAHGLRLLDLSQDPPAALRARQSAEGRLAADPGEAPASLAEIERAVINRVQASGRPACSSAHELGVSVPQGISRLAWAPLWREQQPVGVLIAENMPEEQLDTLLIIAHQISLQLSRIHLYQQVESMAVTDALTGLSVRRAFLERATEELLRSKRHGLACTLLIADLDRFKQKNDTYGHLVGDVVLKEVAQLLKRNLRDIDMIGRYGGEELILLLVETGAEQALPIAQRLRQLVEINQIRAYDEVLTQTISMGMAAFPEDAQSLETLIERSDQALYAAKAAGRNRVVRWSMGSDPTVRKASKGSDPT